MGKIISEMRENAYSGIENPKHSGPTSPQSVLSLKYPYLLQWENKTIIIAVAVWNCFLQLSNYLMLPPLSIFRIDLYVINKS